MRFWDNSSLDAKELGTRIRIARERQGLSQEEFAARISRDQRAVSEFENGKRRITVTELPTLARVLDVPLLYFFEGDLRPNDQDRAVLEQFHRLPNSHQRRAAIDILRIFSDTMTTVSD